MRQRGEVQPYSLLAAETLEDALGEVRAVVGDDAVRVAVAVDDVLEKGDDRLAVPLLDWLGLDPLGELVHRYEEVSHAASRRFEGTDHVEPQTANG